jgi:tetratricopeptide (TPR) repeat protein
MYAGALLHMGHMSEARQQFESIVAERNEKNRNSFEESQGVNHLVLGNAFNSHALWLLGYARTALHSAQAAIEFAREFEQPFNQALAITYQAMLQEWCADTEMFCTHAENAFALTREYKAPYYHAWSNILMCFAHAWRQPDRDHLTRLRKAIREFTETGARLRLPAYFSLLARACQRAGQVDEGLEAIELGLTESLQNNERSWDAELHRLRGEFMGSQGADTNEIEAAYRRAIEIAQSQQARSLELRAATSLARLWQATGRSAAARQLLTPLYSWFTEGFDTPDLEAARTLIAQL